jgi:hypothetical protein
MIRYLFYFLLLVACISCREEEGLKGPLLPPGSYEGTFRRWSAIGPAQEAAHVHLALNDGLFSGASNKTRYPAICNGKYAVTGIEVQFTNFCVWTADFDWSYTLNGTYEISSEGEEFVLRQQRGNWIDVYRLKRNPTIR